MRRTVNRGNGGGWGHSLRMFTAWSVINRESSQAHGFRINLFFMKRSKIDFLVSIVK